MCKKKYFRARKNCQKKIVKLRKGGHSCQITRHKDTDRERKKKVKFYNGTEECVFLQENLGSPGGKSAPTKQELQHWLLQWLKANDPEYLKTKLQKLFDQKGWEIIFTPPNHPQFQPIETCWAQVKNYVLRQYRHSQQNYTKMRNDVIDGFYGKGEHKGITGELCAKMITRSEKNLTQWARAFGHFNIEQKDLVNFGIPSVPVKQSLAVPQPEEFDFTGASGVITEDMKNKLPYRFSFLESDSESEDV